MLSIMRSGWIPSFAGTNGDFVTRSLAGHDTPEIVALGPSVLISRWSMRSPADAN